MTFQLNDERRACCFSYIVILAFVLVRFSMSSLSLTQAVIGWHVLLICYITCAKDFQNLNSMVTWCIN